MAVARCFAHQHRNIEERVKRERATWRRYGGGKASCGTYPSHHVAKQERSR